MSVSGFKRQKYKGEPLVDDCPDADMCVGAPHAFPLLDFYSGRYRALTQKVAVYLSASQTTVNFPLKILFAFSLAKYQWVAAEESGMGV